MFNLFNVPLQKQIIRERKPRSQEIECVLSPAKSPLSDFVCFLHSDIQPRHLPLPTLGGPGVCGGVLCTPRPTGQVNHPPEEQNMAL